MQADSGKNQNYPKVISVLLILFLLTNLAFALLQVYNSPYDHDEFQHVHIAWNIFNDKIIYKDFFEHHGPVFPLLNGLLFDLFDLKPALNTLVFFRLVSFTLLTIMIFLVYLISTEYFKTKPAGLFSAAIFSGLLFIREAATEIRPDVIQNVFWLAGIYLLLINLRKNKKIITYSAGVLLGASFMTNAKAGLGIAAVYIFFLIFFLRYKTEHKKIVPELITLFSGNVTAFVIVALYFYLNNSFKEFFFYNYEFNFIALKEYHSRNLREYAGILLKQQPVFVLAALTAMIITLKKLFTKNVDEESRKVLFVFVISALTSATIFLGLYKQQYLIFLPLLCVVIYQLIMYLSTYNRQNLNHRLLKSITIVLLTGSLLWASISETYFVPSEEQKQQNNLTQFILDKSERTEPVLFLWNNYGGYMFNEDVQFFWLENEGFKPLFNKISGYDVFGNNLIEILKKKNVRFLVTQQKHLKAVLSPGAFEFILQNYNNENEFNGRLWIRNQ